MHNTHYVPELYNVQFIIIYFNHKLNLNLSNKTIFWLKYLLNVVITHEITLGLLTLYLKGPKGFKEKYFSVSRASKDQLDTAIARSKACGLCP